jgi:hypothetical protein
MEIDKTELELVLDIVRKEADRVMALRPGISREHATQCFAATVLMDMRKILEANKRQVTMIKELEKDVAALKSKLSIPEYIGVTAGRDPQKRRDND